MAETTQKGRLLVIVKSVFGISLLLSLLLWNDNGKKAFDVLVQCDIRYIFLLVVLTFFLNMVSSNKWGLFLHDRGVEISKTKLFRLYLIGRFFSNFLPTMVGGDVARAYILGRHINSHATSTASVLMERATGMIALSFLAGVFALANFKMLANPMISISLGAGIGGSILLVVLYYWPAFRQFLIFVIDKLPGFKKLSSKVVKLIDAVRCYRHSYRLLSFSMAYSVLFHLMTGVNVYVVCLAIGFSTDFLDILVITPVIFILTMIPVSPNNIGWWEWCFMVLLGDAGATSAEGLSVALIFRGITLCVSLLGGLLFLYEKRTQSS